MDPEQVGAVERGAGGRRARAGRRRARTSASDLEAAAAGRVERDRAAQGGAARDGAAEPPGGRRAATGPARRRARRARCGRWGCGRVQVSSPVAAQRDAPAAASAVDLEPRAGRRRGRRRRSTTTSSASVDRAAARASSPSTGSGEHDDGERPPPRARGGGWGRVSSTGGRSPGHRHRGRMPSSTPSAVAPSSSSSGRSWTRWRSAGLAIAFTSSGVTKSRPLSQAHALAACSSIAEPRGDTPRDSDGDSRVARARLTT